MSVMYPLAIVDATSIMTQIKMRLLYPHSNRVLHTQVETNEGAVTLEGKAWNAAEKDLVTRRVSDVRGVRSVKNQMALEEAKGQ